MTAAQPGEPGKRPPRILILDDDDGMRKSLAEVIASAGYVAVSAAKGERALQLAEKEPFNAAFIDLNLADMPGLEVLRRLKENNPDTECILITAFASQESAIEALNLDVFAYFQKPLDIDHLLRALRRALDKRAAEMALRASEERFRLVLENLSDEVYAHELDGRIVFANRASCVMTGFTREELLGKYVWDIDPGSREEFDLDALWNSLVPGEEKILEVQHRRKDGSVYPVEVHLSRMNYQGRQIVLATARDISARKRTEAEIMKASELQRLLMELATGYVNVPIEQTDSAIDEALGIIGAFTGVDRAYLFGFDFQADTASNTHEWCAPGIEPVIGQLQDIPNSLVPDWVKAHKQGEVFLVPRVGNLPKNSGVRRLLEPQGIRTLVTVPLMDGVTPLGFVGFDAVKAERIWREPEVDLLRVLATLLANMLLRRQREQALQANESKLSSIFRAAPVGIGVVVDRVFTEVNQRLCDLTGYTREDLLGKSARMLYPDDEEFNFVGTEKYRQIDESGIGEVETQFRRADGAVIHVLLRSSPVDRQDLSKGVTFTVLDIGERKRIESALQASEARFRALYENTPIAYQVIDQEGRITDVNRKWRAVLGYSREEVLEKTVFDLMAPHERDSARASYLEKVNNGTVIHEGSVQAFIARSGETRMLRSAFFLDRDAQGSLISTLVTIEDITEQQQREREMAALVNVSAALRTAETRAEMLPVLLDQVLELMDTDGATLEMLDPASGDFIIELGRGIWEPVTGQRIPAGTALSGRVLASGKPYINNRADREPDLFRPELFEGCRAAAGLPLKVQEHVIGLLWVGSKRDLTESDMRLLGALADMAANAIHRSTLHEQTERRVAQLDALRSIEQTINSSMDMRVTFNVILQQATSLLQADALAVLLYNSRTLQLNHAASTGFRSGRIRETSMRIGEGHAGKAALERHFIGVDDIRGYTKVKNGISFLEDEGFLSYHAIPLIVKAEIKGVLEVFHRAPYTPDEEWMANLRALATQAAIAIDNHEMFDGLQRAASNLSLAVDETLESWGKALALRSGGQGQDTRRLTDMTLRLARAAGVNDADSVHLVRGALLHDVGEMAVPEALLNKTGALTDEEWEVVRAHPQVAYDLIYPIRHLRPALDIPYCHHERWDGSGYPRGLKGEAIPLAARVFAVVDVYDALISKRPYRPAWKNAKAQAYIREGSGSQFDPRMVELFFKILKDFEKE